MAELIAKHSLFDHNIDVNAAGGNHGACGIIDTHFHPTNNTDITFGVKGCIIPDSPGHYTLTGPSGLGHPVPTFGVGINF